ncbi:hypothetical protein DAZ38_28300, partial [Salmonella enterica subsp. enterica serovar Enteritidis]|nr:hypothetical protein [Salmonella enterica subsp. enterica serovar Enteritidis]
HVTFLYINKCIAILAGTGRKQKLNGGTQHMKRSKAIRDNTQLKRSNSVVIHKAALFRAASINS